MFRQRLTRKEHSEYLDSSELKFNDDGGEERGVTYSLISFMFIMLQYYLWADKDNISKDPDKYINCYVCKKQRTMNMSQAKAESASYRS